MSLKLFNSPSMNTDSNWVKLDCHLLASRIKILEGVLEFSKNEC